MLHSEVGQEAGQTAQVPTCQRSRSWNGVREISRHDMKIRYVYLGWEGRGREESHVTVLTLLVGASLRHFPLLSGRVDIQISSSSFKYSLPLSLPSAPLVCVVNEQNHGSSDASFPASTIASNEVIRTPLGDSNYYYYYDISKK